MPAYTEHSWRFWYDYSTDIYSQDETVLENDSIYTLFDKPVEIYSGSKLKVIRYVELVVAPPVYGPEQIPSNFFNHIRPISYQESMKHGWDQTGTDQFTVMKDPTYCIRNSVAGMSCGILGKEGVKRGFHQWKVYWHPSEYGIHPSIGIASKKTKLTQKRYEPLIGADLHSYGWHLRYNCLLHDFKSFGKRFCPSYPGLQHRTSEGQFIPTPEILILLDMESGTLGFSVGGVYLGHAFTNIYQGGVRFYPAVSCSWGHAKIQIKYVGGFYPQPDSLLSQTKRKVPKRIISRLTKTLEFSHEFKKFPSMEDEDSFEQKKLNFISEPIDRKDLMELCGVDEEIAKHLQKAGFDDASMVLGQFLLFLKDQSSFISWFKEAGHATTRQAKECYECLAEWCKNFL